MKTILITITVITAILYGCGNDTVTSNNTGTVQTFTTLYQKDTFSVHTSAAGNIERDLSETFSANLGNFKLSFDVACNNDTNTFDYLYYGIVQNGNVIISGILSHPALNNHYEYTGNSDTNTVNLIGTTLHLKNITNLQIEKYMKVSNIKIIRND